MERVVLNAKLRSKLGKSGAKELRRQGIIPCGVYAKNESPTNLQIDCHEFMKFLRKEGENAVIDLKLDSGNKVRNKTVIIKEIQYNILTQGVLHIDFQSISLEQVVRMHVPLVTKGNDECQGVKDGGIIEHVLHELEIECLPGAVPKEILVDVTGVNVGEAICVKDLKIPEGIKIVNGSEQVAILVKVEVGQEKEEESEVQEQSAPEVLKQKKKEED
ncbi:MAG: 50S ribosomal protein L25 [Candidatus Omnitrophota bacterium]|nr:MAG: 50S ribosomal protein L25 [Candidatus Omnitrophota bacterium]